MRFYLNTSVWNRPFDDLSSERIRLEAEAVAVLLSAAERRRVEIISSDYVEFEIDQTPDPERARRVRRLLYVARSAVEVSARVADRARELEGFGLRGLDALHVAAAEAGGADALVTTDDRMVRSARRAGGRLGLRVVRPAQALDLLADEEGA